MLVERNRMTETIAVKAPVSGTVDVKVAPGDSISQGDLLAIQNMVKVHRVFETTFDVC